MAKAKAASGSARKKAAKKVAKRPAPTPKPAPPKPERVRLGTLEITGDHVLVGDPSFLDGVGGDLLRSPSVPSGRFPVYADLLVADGEERVGRLLLVFDEAKFEDAAAGRFAEPLDRLNVDAAMLCFLDGAHADELRRTVTLAGVWEALCRSHEGWGRRVARVPAGAGGDDGAQMIACVPGFGDGSYTLFWWYGEDVSYAPHQDIAALGVVTLKELDPWA